MTQKILYKVFLLLFSVSSFSFAQSKSAASFEEGYIIYDIRIVGVPEIAEFLRETTLTLYVKGEQSKMDLRIMGGFAQMQLVSNIDNDIHTVLMDLPMLPEKVSIPLVGDDDVFQRLNSKTHTNHSPRDFGKIINYEQDMRKIAKQPCYRAELPFPGSGNQATMYLAKKLKPAHSIQILEQFGISDALPLAMNVTIDGVQFHIIAKEFKRVSIQDEIFEVSDEYNQQTFKELYRSIEDVFGGARKEGVGL